MCGVVSMLNLNGAHVCPDLLGRMAMTLSHRGPDDQGVHVDGAVGLAHRRLSIIDVEGGHQPMANEDDTVWVAFNGEIYNFTLLRVELRARGHSFRTRTDTEVIVHAFEEFGSDCFGKLWGMFAIVLWDSARRRLIIARDRVGKKPLYYYRDTSKFIVASEMKAILAHPGVNHEVSVVGLDEYLRYGYVPGCRTIYQHINKLPPAHFGCLGSDGEFSINSYWEFPEPHPEKPHAPDAYAEELGVLLEDAIRLRLVSDVPLGAFLSGGVDSSVVVAGMRKMLSRTTKTFTIGFAEESYDESQYAREVASWLGTEHHEHIMSLDPVHILERVMRYFDEPYADVSAIPAYCLAEATRRQVTVSLSGDGGDELFGGYARYVGQQVARWYVGVPPVLRNAFVRLVNRIPEGTGNRAESLLKQVKWVLDSADRLKRDPLDSSVCLFPGAYGARFLSPEVRAELARERREERFSFVEKMASCYSNLDAISRMMWTDARTYMVDDVLVKVDRMSMAHSLEVRCPLLDHRLIEFMARVPADQKVRGLKTKCLLKRYAASLLPRTIVRRRKRGFSVPVGRWLRGPLRPMVSDVLLQGPGSRWLNNDEVRSLVKEHLSGRCDLGIGVWALLVFSLWERSACVSS